MTGFDTSDGYRIAPLDNRDEEDPEYTIDPKLSSPDFQFSEDDPATIPPEEGKPAAELATFDPEEVRERVR